MTINPSAWILLAMYVARRRGARPATSTKLSGHDPGRHPQGVHRAEGVDLPAAPVDADRARHDHLLPPSTCRATTRSTSRATTSPRRARAPCRRRPSRWPTRVAYVRRGDRGGRRRRRRSRRGWRSTSSPSPTSSRRSRSSGRCGASTRRSCASEFGATKAESMRLRFHCQTAAATLTKAAARQQRRADRVPGALRRARRRPVAAHQRARRGLRDPDRGRDEDRAAHAADHRRRDAA